MQTKLIQKKADIGSQVEFTLSFGNQVSGLLKEIGLEHVTLDTANGEMTLMVESIVAVLSLDNLNRVEGTPDTPDEIQTPNLNPVEGTPDTPDEIQTPNLTDTNAKPADSPNFEEQASEQLVRILTRFNTEAKALSLELEPPNFTFPATELTNWKDTDVAGKWLKIKNKYENAQRINELNPKFGRIQPLLMEVESLVRRFPNSSSLKRIIAYFYAVSADWEKSTQLYQEVAITSQDFNDWFNVAVSALNTNKEELACYSLGKFFNNVSVIDKVTVWYIYVNLVEKFNDLPTFRELCQKKEDDNVAENEIEVLLDAAIYLLKKGIATESATEIVQKRLKGKPSAFLLNEVCQKLGGPSTESYRQFLADLMEGMIASEKIIRPISPKYTEHTVPMKKSSYHMPSAEDPYAIAKRADLIEKNLEKAEHFYRECIRKDIRHDSAIKDLAMVLVRLDRPEEAVEVLEKNRPYVQDKISLDNVLISVYPAAAQYEKTIELLNVSLKQASKKEQKANIRFQIASNYFKLGNYAKAELQFRQVLGLRPDHIAAKRNIALCLSKQGKYKEAEEVLSEILLSSQDAKTDTLLEAVERAQETGEFNLDDESIIPIETGLSYFSGELSKFARFFLDRCTFSGVSPERVIDGQYTGSEKDFRYDIDRLEGAAKQFGTRRPRDRGQYYLSAARICFDFGDNQNAFYRYLCRSFASRGDAAAGEYEHLDTVRDWYCEALAAYDGVKTRSHRRSEPERDAVNSLVRYLSSTLGRSSIVLNPKINKDINTAVKNAIDTHSDKPKVFGSILYLVLRSKFAADRVLKSLYRDQRIQTMAIKYLRQNGIEAPDTIEQLDDFILLWDELRRKKDKEALRTSNKLQPLNNFSFSISWLEANITFIEDIVPNLFLELDRQRIEGLQRILESGLELCKQGTFEERERLCIQLRSSCQDLLEKIESSPTRLSVENVYFITEVVQRKVETYLNELYETSKPQLNLRLPVESYVPTFDQKIEVQIVLENERGRSPAESLELIVQDDPASFTVSGPTVKQNESLRGGEQSILAAPLLVTPDALKSQTFSLSLYAQYRTRTGEQAKTPLQSFSIRLYPEDGFERIENPYATYAEGGVVGDENMFFGRERLIKDITTAIQNSRAQSKSVMVFGQKRSGKSSVLYHLKKSLQKDRNLLILDLENIAAILGENSNIDDSKNSLLNQILRSILTGLQYTVEDAIDEGFTPLDIPFPSDLEFYSHPHPQQYFVEIFKSFKRQVYKKEDWCCIRVVLLIDEFQYIYARIVDGKIPKSFMESWKAFLQANYFHTVLVGQDVMQKFKADFPNEFGTTQDERVTYLGTEDARRLIDDPIRVGGRHGESRYREQAIDRILELTAGSPFYIQIICNRLVEYMNVKHAGLVTEADVENVKNELIRGVNALGLDKFDNLINSGDTSPDAISDNDALKVLKAIADNSSRTDPCPHDRINCETDSLIDIILDDLENRDVVKRSDRSYQIRVGLFKEWLIENG